MNQTQINKAWSNAKIIKNKNSNTHRQDPYGNLIYKNSYGKSSAMGWEVDYIKPKSMGGSDATCNLQALKFSVNRVKGNSFIKKSRHSKGNK